MTVTSQVSNKAHARHHLPNILSSSCEIGKQASSWELRNNQGVKKNPCQFKGFSVACWRCFIGITTPCGAENDMYTKINGRLLLCYTLLCINQQK